MSKKKFHMDKEVLVWLIIALVFAIWTIIGTNARSRYP